MFVDSLVQHMCARWAVEGLFDFKLPLGAVYLLPLEGCIFTVRVICLAGKLKDALDATQWYFNH